MRANKMTTTTPMTAEASDSGFPFWEASRRRFDHGDPFFASGNLERELLAKHVALDLTNDERNQLHDMECTEDQLLFCPIVDCGSRLKSLEDFEDHYHARHTASCSVCSRVYPTSRLLSIHVSEAHDSFFKAKVARGFPMYECLVEGCGMKFINYQSRQQHLVDKHKFPTSFEFFKKAHPSKQQRRKHHRKQVICRQDASPGAYMDAKFSSSKQDTKNVMSKETGHEKEGVKGMDVDGGVEDLISAVSKLTTSDSTPSSISFGRRHNRAFNFLPRSVQRNTKNAGSAGKTR